MISSKEILSAGEISRATLNNYIRLGILPRPVVLRPVIEKGGPRQMGYFPLKVLDTLKKVSVMKSEGCSMEMIAAKLKAPTGHGSYSVKRPVQTSTVEKTALLPLFIDPPQQPVPRKQHKIGKSSTAPKIMYGEPPSLLSVSILVATLHDFDRLRIEWLPQDLFTLVKRIWTFAADIAGMNHGLVIDRSGCVMTMLFSSEGNPSYIKNALNTAIMMKKKMQRLNQDLPSEGLTVRETIHLNIGIGMGEEHIAIMKDTIPGVLASPGFALIDAITLSQFAVNGAVWATKNAICRMPTEDRQSFRFGVRRGGAFEESIFSHLRDLICDSRESIPRSVDFHDRLIAAEIFTESE